MIWPKTIETWVVPHRPEMVCAIMKRKVKEVNRQSLSMEDEHEQQHYLFNGKVYAERFTISRKIDRPDNFIPLIKGEWIGSDKGSLMRITYQLFGSTLMFLGFWTIVCILSSLLMAFFYQEYMLAVSVLLIGLLNYWVSISNFKKRVKECRKVLQEVLA